MRNDTVLTTQAKGSQTTERPCTHKCAHAHTTRMHARARTHRRRGCAFTLQTQSRSGQNGFLCLQKVRDPDWLAHYLNIFPTMARCCHSDKEKANCVVGSALPPRLPWGVCHHPARRVDGPQDPAGPGSASPGDTTQRLWLLGEQLHSSLNRKTWWEQGWHQPFCASLTFV